MKNVFRIVLALLIMAGQIGGGVFASPKVALGHLGLSSSEANEALAGIIMAMVSSDSRVTMVERATIDLALRETELKLAGISRAGEAIRVGQLLPVDWFVLGATTPVSGTNALLIRIVNAKTGIIRSVTVFNEIQRIDKLGNAIAQFILEMDWARQTPRSYIAIGAIEDVGINNRFHNFAGQLRAQLPLLMQREVTFLERDAMAGLLNEIRLDSASLTQHSEESNQKESAFWLFDAFYQSYEVNEPEVELVLRIEKIKGGHVTETLRGKPSDDFFLKVSALIKQAMANPALQASIPIAADRQAEIQALLKRGKSLVQLGPLPIVLVRGIADHIKAINAADATKAERAVAEARKAFESILLLDPDHCEAKLYLGACLSAGAAISSERFSIADDDHIEKARILYREIIGAADPMWVDHGRLGLVYTYCMQERYIDAFALFARFEKDTTNPKVAAECLFGQQNLISKMQDNEMEYPFMQVVPLIEKMYYRDLEAANNSTEETLPKILGPAFTLSLSPYIRFQSGKYNKSRLSHRDYIEKEVMPKVKKEYPLLWPYVLLGNIFDCKSPKVPAVTLLLEQLDLCKTNYALVLHPKVFFRRLIPTAKENKELRGWNQFSVYDWLFATSNYEAVVHFAKTRQQAAIEGLAEPLTDVAKVTQVYSYMHLKDWSNALEVLNSITNHSIPINSLGPKIDVSFARGAGTGPWASTGSHFDIIQVRNQCLNALGRNELEPAIRNPADWAMLDDQHKVELAVTYMNEKQWETAISILKPYKRRTVLTSCGGPWGNAYAPAFPELLMEECERKLNRTVVPDPLRFEFGKPLISSKGNVSFFLEDQGVWMAMANELSHTRDLKSLSWNCSMASNSVDTIFTSICRKGQTVWLATSDKGLFEFDLPKRNYRQYRVKDGLLLDNISCLFLQDNTLWIGYGEAGRSSTPGGLGKLDLATHCFSALTPTISKDKYDRNENNQESLKALKFSSEKGRKSIFAIAAESTGKLWLAGEGLYLYSIADNKWASFPMDSISSFASDTLHNRLIVGTLDTSCGKSSSGDGKLFSINFDSSNKWEWDIVGKNLPVGDVSAIAADGNIVWVGGNGYLAIVDMSSWSLLRIAYAPIRYIHQIKLDPDYAWVRVGPSQQPIGGSGWHQAGSLERGLYRFPRSLEKAISADTAAGTTGKPREL